MSKNEFFDEFEDNTEPAENTVTTGNVVAMQKKPVQIGPIIAKLKAIEKEVCNNLIERDEAVRDCMLALVSRNHIFLYGPPGTGKTKLITEIKNRIDLVGYFQMMLNKTTDISEVFGPISIPAMEKDIIKRITKDKLPEASLIFLDEIFKCNSPILNSLLTALNERVFYNDGIVKIPLLTMFCASNEIPYEEELMALYDRIMFRENIEYVKDPANRVKMYKNFLNQNATPVGVKVTLDEIKLLQSMVPKVIIPDGILKDFELIQYELYKNNGIVISDRRKNACLRILQTSALLEGRKQVTGDDFVSLVNVLWNQPTEIDAIRKELIKKVNPYLNDFKDYIEKFEEVRTRIKNADGRDKDQLVIESKGPLQKLLTKMNNTINNAKGEGRDVTEMVKKRDDMTAEVKRIMEESLSFEAPVAPAHNTTTINSPEEYVDDAGYDFGSVDVEIPF